MTAAPVDKPAPAAAPAPKDASPPPPAPTPIQPIDAAVYVDDAPAFSSEVQTILAQEPDPEIVEVRKVGKDSDRELLYVPWVHYQRVLVEAFGRGGFRLVPRGVVRTEGNVVTWTGALFVRAPGATKFQFVKEAKGECALHGGMTPGNAAEGAQSDCLVKCCKGLNIFDHLWDPRWRRAWEARYRGQHAKNVRAAEWPSAAAERAGHIGNGGPAVDVPASPGTAPPSRDDTGDERPDDEATPPTGDTGEPATDEQKEAVRTRLRGLKFTRGYVRQWFHSVFGGPLNIDDPVGWLSQRQADAAYLLLNVHGKPLYNVLLKRWQETGTIEDPA